MSKPLWINDDAGAPEYTARDLRRALAALLAQDVADRLGARSGVRPGPPAVSLSGTTVTVHHHAGVVYPGLTATAGPYPYALTENTHALDPADGSNPRIDAIDIQVQDDDEDTSGERRVRSVYVVGTPAASPVAPAASATSFRAATILVPAGGSPAPSLTYVAPTTVAAGGILPVRDASEYPTDGLYDGRALADQDLRALIMRFGGSWVNITDPVLDVAEVTSGTEASLTLVVPEGVTAARVVGVGRTTAAVARTNLQVSLNNISSTNQYRFQRTQTPGDGAAPATVFQTRDGDFVLGSIVAGDNATAGEFGEVEILLPNISAGTRRRIRWQGSVVPTTTDSDSMRADGHGRILSTSQLETVQLFSGSPWVAGTRFELRHA